MWLFPAAGGRPVEEARKFQCVGITTISVSAPSGGQQAHAVFVANETMPNILTQDPIFEKYCIQR